MRILNTLPLTNKVKTFLKNALLFGAYALPLWQNQLPPKPRRSKTDDIRLSVYECCCCK